jgi:hypothetical protein
MPPWLSKDLPRIMRVVACLMATSGIAPLAAQQVRGRLVLASDSSAVSEALVLLLDQKRTEVARTASTASGGFLLVAPGPGTYWLRVQRIGFQAWETNSPPLAAGGSWTPVLAIPEVPYALPELMAYGGKSLCGVALGNADVMAKLLEAAQTTLGLAEAGFSGEERKFKVQTWRHTVRADGTPLDSTPSLAPRQLSGWPIKSADPESLRAWGFERGTWPDPRKVVPGPNVGPVFYGPDARVLFTDWFLDSHCFSLAKPKSKGDSLLVVRFKPAKHAGRGALEGRYEFDLGSLALQTLVFEFVKQPDWVPDHGAGGAMRFVRLDDGAWLPASWRMRAPVPAANAALGVYEFYGFAETGGFVVEAMKPDGTPDDTATATLTAARELLPLPTVGPITPASKTRVVDAPRAAEPTRRRRGPRRRRTSSPPLPRRTRVRDWVSRPGATGAACEARRTHRRPRPGG